MTSPFQHHWDRTWKTIACVLVAFASSSVAWRTDAETSDYIVKLIEEDGEKTIANGVPVHNYKFSQHYAWEQVRGDALLAGGVFSKDPVEPPKDTWIISFKTSSGCSTIHDCAASLGCGTDAGNRCMVAKDFCFIVIRDLLDNIDGTLKQPECVGSDLEFLEPDVKIKGVPESALKLKELERPVPSFAYGVRTGRSRAGKHDPGRRTSVPGEDGSALLEASLVTLPSPSEREGHASEVEAKRWGLRRIGQPQSTSKGRGVHVYILDTGINYAHKEFGGRAFPFLESLSYTKVCDSMGCALDRNGHGTHVAGIVGAATSGVAPEATIFGAKVLDDTGEGYMSSFIDACERIAEDILIVKVGPSEGAQKAVTLPAADLQCLLDPCKERFGISIDGDVMTVTQPSDQETAGWVEDLHVKLRRKQATTLRHPTVITASLGAQRDYFSTAMRETIDEVSARGITVVVAAGNEGGDACQFSPAFVPTAITVGSVRSTDERSAFSNWGACVSLYAPGSMITSISHSDPEASELRSGTSMACPHVAGAAALLLEMHPDWTAKQVRHELVSLSGQNTVTNTMDRDFNRTLQVPGMTVGLVWTPAPTPPKMCPDGTHADDDYDCACHWTQSCYSQDDAGMMQFGCPWSRPEGLHDTFFSSSCETCVCSECPLDVSIGPDANDDCTCHANFDCWFSDESAGWVWGCPRANSQRDKKKFGKRCYDCGCFPPDEESPQAHLAPTNSDYCEWGIRVSSESACRSAGLELVESDVNVTAPSFRSGHWHHLPSGCSLTPDDEVMFNSKLGIRNHVKNRLVCRDTEEVFHFAPNIMDFCHEEPGSFAVPQEACQDAARQLIANGGKSPGRPMRIGGWDFLPEGCSVLTGADWTVYFNTKVGSTNLDGRYQLVCSKPREFGAGAPVHAGSNHSSGSAAAAARAGDGGAASSWPDIHEHGVVAEGSEGHTPAGSGDGGTISSQSVDDKTLRHEALRRQAFDAGKMENSAAAGGTLGAPVLVAWALLVAWRSM